VGTKRSTRLSVNACQDSNRKTSDQRLQKVKEKHLSRMTLTKKNARQRTLYETPKPEEMRTVQGNTTQKSTFRVPENKIVSSVCNLKQKEQKRRKSRVMKNTKPSKYTQFNTEQNTKVKTSSIPKLQTIKQKAMWNARKRVAKTYLSFLPGIERLSPEHFPTLFLDKIDAKCHPETSHMSSIHCISVSNDNLVWVNHLRKCVHLLNTSGEILRTIQLDYRPVFSCCTPSGYLLVTQGYAMFSKPVITLITRDGNSRVLANLSSYATVVSGILCENEAIFVVCYTNKPGVHGNYKGYFITKLNMSGEVEEIY
jgi:hypothetical protein